MPLDLQVQKLLQQLDELKLPPLTTLTPVEARVLTARLRGKPLRPQKLARVESCAIAGSNKDINLRIYTPELNTILPVLVYFHGGGWLLGDLDAAEPICLFLANAAKCIVVSVDYPLAPEHKFPVAVEEAYAATHWVAQNAAAFNGDPTRIAVGGDSAGGTLAAVVALMARDRGTPSLLYQLLIYPPTCYGFDTDSYQKYGTGGFGLTKEEMVWFWHHYLPSPEAGENPYASPLLAACQNLPPAYIITAECDVLRDEAQAYALRLQAAGVPVLLKNYQGMIHSFVGMASVLSQGKLALAEIAAQLRMVFEQ